MNKTEIFKEKVFNLASNEYNVLGDYINNRKKIKIIHNTCGNIYEVAPYSFLNGSRCPKCAIQNRRRTHEQYLEQVYNLVGDEYSLLSNYVNVRTPISIQHNDCGYVYKVRPDCFLEGNRCPKCKKDVFYFENKKEFERIVFEKFKDEYTILKGYSSSKKNIEVIHNLCNTEYSVSTRNFLLGSSCKKCSNYQRTLIKNNEELVERMKEIVGNEYVFLEEYKSSKEKLKIVHNRCETIYEVSPDNFLRGTRCPICAHEKRGFKVIDTDIFKREVLELVGTEYIVEGKYSRSKDGIKMKHSGCEKTFKVKRTSFLRGERCPHCFKNTVNINKLNIEEKTDLFKEKVYKLVGLEYEVLGGYVNSYTHSIKMMHTTCGFVYKVLPKNFLQGSRCPNCIKSKGAKEVGGVLKKLDKSYSVEYRIKECKNKRPLPFDFAVFDENKKLKCLIEFDGEQHFKSVEIWGGEKGLLRTQKNDSIKNKYCEENNIPLLRIPFWEYINIEKIVTNFINNLFLLH